MMEMDLLAIEFSPTHLPILLVIGLAIFFGAIGAKVFQRLRIPQVVGYIAIGLLLGRSVIGFIDERTIEELSPFSFFALGVIGFMIGGELHRDVFKRYGKQFFVILFSEGLGAFFLVSVFVSVAAILVGQSISTAIALGIVLGAISSATAPAATVDVLWEYKTRGMLTTTVFAIVALDDGLALVLYSISSSIAGRIIGHGGQFAQSILGACYELLGAAALGAVSGLLLNFILRRIRDPDKSLALIIGVMAFLIGAARVVKVDVILAAMTLGVVLSNLAPRRSRESFEIVEQFAQPIYVLFFVIVGARLYIGGMQWWLWVLAVVYVIGRTAGKMLGANLGARFSGATESVRKYLGLCLFSQAGVAIGLSILASMSFSPKIGGAIIMIVTATTLLVQIIGPPCVKLAVKKAGEIGLDVTEEDLMRSYKVRDVVNRTTPTFHEDSRLGDILRTIAQTDAMSYPVIDAGGKLVGIITIEELKRSFVDDEMTNWLLAYDLMRPVPDVIEQDAPLIEAITRMREQNLSYIPVVESRDNPRLVGMLELSAVERYLSGEVIRRRQLAGT